MVEELCQGVRAAGMASLLAINGVQCLAFLSLILIFIVKDNLSCAYIISENLTYLGCLIILLILPVLMLSQPWS